MELISKDEAIVMLEDMEGRRDEDGYIRVYKSDVIANLRSLSSVEERKEGEWVYESCSRLIDETDEGRVYTIEKRWHCSRCGHDKGFWKYRPDDKYCPNCGAYMKGE